MKSLLKTTEGLIVFFGLFLTLSYGRFFAIATGVAYAAVNIPNFWKWIQETFNKVKTKVEKL